MTVVEHVRSVERSDVLDYVLGILNEITADWDIGEIGPETQLGSLGLESISLVYLIGEIQRHYDLHDQLFERLRTAKTNIADQRVADVVDLVSEMIASQSTRAGGGEA